MAFLHIVSHLAQEVALAAFTMTLDLSEVALLLLPASSLVPFSFDCCCRIRGFCLGVLVGILNL